MNFQLGHRCSLNGCNDSRPHEPNYMGLHQGSDTAAPHRPPTENQEEEEEGEGETKLGRVAFQSQASRLLDAYLCSQYSNLQSMVERWAGTNTATLANFKYQTVLSQETQSTARWCAEAPSVLNAPR